MKKKDKLKSQLFSDLAQALKEIVEYKQGKRKKLTKSRALGDYGTDDPRIFISEIIPEELCDGEKENQ